MDLGLFIDQNILKVPFSKVLDFGKFLSNHYNKKSPAYGEVGHHIKLRKLPEFRDLAGKN